MQWNKIIYEDCMNPDYGLPTLKYQSIELCFTDPPYNKNYKSKLGFGHNYEDNREDYLYFCMSWFKQLKRICEGILIHCGFSNLNMWIADIEKPRGILYHYKEDVQCIGSVAYLEKLTPILVYGDVKRMNINPIRIKNKYDKYRGTSNHPCPINYGLVFKILKQLKPKTVIDPFMGSGTTAFCCRNLGIKYFGYERDKIYKRDIDRRLGQLSLSQYT